MDGIAIFHGGDSGYVELKNYPSDVAFLPTGRMSPTASPENAYKMAVDLKPKQILPMHGSEKQKHQFEEKIRNGMSQSEVLMIEPFTPQLIALK